MDWTRTGARAERERDLIAAAQTGDESAFRELYQAYHRRIWTLVLYSVGDPLQAVDDQVDPRKP